MGKMKKISWNVISKREIKNSVINGGRGQGEKENLVICIEMWGDLMGIFMEFEKKLWKTFWIVILFLFAIRLEFFLLFFNKILVKCWKKSFYRYEFFLTNFNFYHMVFGFSRIFFNKIKTVAAFFKISIYFDLLFDKVLENKKNFGHQTNF